MSSDTSKTVAVIGAGTMGRGIAQIFAQSGYAVRLHDVMPKALESAMECPGGVDNPFLQLRLGQAYYELGQTDDARAHLQIALDKEGQTIFGFDDPKYYEFITAH